MDTDLYKHCAYAKIWQAFVLKKRIPSFNISEDNVTHLWTVNVLCSCRAAWLHHRWTVCIAILRLARTRYYFNYSAQYKKGNGASHIYCFCVFYDFVDNRAKIIVKSLSCIASAQQCFEKNVSESRMINTFRRYLFQLDTEIYMICTFAKNCHSFVRQLSRRHEAYFCFFNIAGYPISQEKCQSPSKILRLWG